MGTSSTVGTGLAGVIAFEGEIHVSTEGDCGIARRSDDGSQLRIYDEEVIGRWVTSHREYAFVLGLGFATQVEIWSQPVLAPDRYAVAAIGLGMTAVLLFRRRAPLLTLAAAVIASRLEIVAVSVDRDDAPLMTVILYMVAIYSSAVHTRGRSYLLATLLVTGFHLQILWFDPANANVTGFVFVGIFSWGPFLAGTAIRHRRQREELLVRQRDERARQAVADERIRIARELHDVVAHAIGVIVLQARGARRSLTDDPDDAVDALNAIEHTATEALNEMRHLLAILRSDEVTTLAPQPSLAHLDTLVGNVQRSGLSVEVRIQGEPRELSPGLDASAYRIVQEALTNAIKHAGQCKAVVTVRYHDDTVDIDVADDGLGTAGGEAGHGLMGMRERAAVFGGTIDAGPRHGGGYAVHAHLPTG